MAYSYGPPQLDFTPLANLGDTFFRARDQAAKRMQEEEAPGLFDEYVRSLGGGTAQYQPQPQGRTLGELGQGLPQPAPYNVQGKTPVFASVSGVPGQQGSIQGDMARYGDAIASIESRGSGDYAAVGPTHPKYGRPLGRYQVMEANIPEWSRAALGREVTADEFLRDPKLQDAIFQHQFGNYVTKYGNPQDAASAWFTGRPRGTQGSDTAQDSLGTTGSQYVAKFTQNLGADAADVPAQGAQPAQGFVIPGQATGQQLNGDLLRRMYANPSTRPLATAILSERLKGRDVKTVDLGGSIAVMDNQGNILRQIPKQSAEKWQRLSDGALFNPATGETRAVEGQDASMFRGNSVDAQALNELVRTGRLTREQAAQFAAGKTVTGPNGEQLFLTPQGVFSSPAPNAAPAAGTATAANAPAPRDGVIPLTSPKPEKPTEGQSNAALYAKRMMEADAVLSDPAITAAMQSRMQSGLYSLPGGNSLVLKEYQKADQAKRNFINAVLRRESGAVISPDEFANAERQYFPQPGDGDEVLRQKAQNRSTAIQGISSAAGPAAPKPPPPAYRKGQTATNPQTGERMIFDGTNWTPLKQAPTTTRPQA